MSEWREIELGEILTLQRGFDLPAQQRVDGPFPIVSSSGLTGSHVDFKVHPPGVVIGRTGTLGSVFWIQEPFWPLNTSLWVKDFKGNDPRFVSYLLKTVTVDGSTASAVPGVNRNHLHKLPVRLPSRTTQRRIAAVLSAFDELIEINERRIELLEALARELYREWFVHFRFPGHEHVEFVDSELGPVPDGWEVRPLGHVAEFTSGNSLTKAAYVSTGFTAFSASGPDGFLSTFDVEGRGVVLSAVGARCGRTFRAAGRWSAIANTIRYAPREGECGWSWLYLATSDRNRWPKRGAAQPFVSINDARNLSVVVPGWPLMRYFEDHTVPLYDLITTLIEDNRALTSTRDLLLPRLVTGRLDISDVDFGDLLPDEAT